MEAFLYLYLGIMWFGLGFYMARFYTRQYRSDPSRYGQNVPGYLWQGGIWVVGVYWFTTKVAHALS